MRLFQKTCRACLAVTLAVMAASCMTQRTEMGPVRRKFGFESGLWGGQGGGAGGDEKEIKAKYANAGWNLDKEGNITGAKNKDMFEGKVFQGDKNYRKKEARLKNREVTRDVYRTPEYLERQGYKGSKSAQEAQLASRESDFDQNRAGESGRNARGPDDSPGFLAGLNPFRSKNARESDRSFKAGSDREGTRAQENAAIPNPGPAMSPRGNYREAALTMDDVKKMLRPEEFD